MIFDKLNDRQKLALLSAAKQMMVADARIFKEEMVFYELLNDQISAGLDKSRTNPSGAIDLEAFDDPRSIRILLFTLNTMAFADGEFHSEESALLNSICDSFGLPAEELEEILSLAARQGRLINEITQMLAVDRDR